MAFCSILQQIFVDVENRWSAERWCSEHWSSSGWSVDMHSCQPIWRRPERIQTVCWRSRRLELFLFEAAQNFEIFSYIQNKITKSKTYSGWCPDQGLFWWHHSRADLIPFSQPLVTYISPLLFRWDPVFQPAEHQLTYAEMDADTKNSISHRGRALQKLIQHFVKP